MTKWDELGAWRGQVGGVGGVSRPSGRGLLAIFTTAVGRPELNIRISVQRSKEFPAFLRAPIRGQQRFL